MSENALKLRALLLARKNGKTAGFLRLTQDELRRVAGLIIAGRP